MDTEQDSVRTNQRPARSGAPRFGSLFTIAVALLLLFGAISNYGRLQQSVAFLGGLDSLAETRIRSEESRLKTAITIGARPVEPQKLHPVHGTLPINPDAMPRQRPDVDPEHVRRPAAKHAPAPSASAVVSIADLVGSSDEEFVPVMEQTPAPRPAAPARPATVTVDASDTWFKIAQRTLGDGKRWQEIMNINPAAKNGLRPGMTLAIPQ